MHLQNKGMSVCIHMQSIFEYKYISSQMQSSSTKIYREIWSVNDKTTIHHNQMQFLPHKNVTDIVCMVIKVDHWELNKRPISLSVLCMNLFMRINSNCTEDALPTRTIYKKLVEWENHTVDFCLQHSTEKWNHGVWELSQAFPDRASADAQCTT